MKYLTVLMTAIYFILVITVANALILIKLVKTIKKAYLDLVAAFDGVNAELDQESTKLHR